MERARFGVRKYAPGPSATMANREELERRLWELIDAADWDNLTPRLQAFIRTYLSQYGESEGRRWQNVTHSYAVRTVEMVLKRGAASARWHDWQSLFELLCRIAAQLIDDDERRLKDLLETADWADIIPRVIAHTVRQFGSASGPHGQGAEDYVYDAVVQLFTRRRHFPIDREVSLFTFLCKTVRGMRTNEQASLAGRSLHMSPDDDSAGPAVDRIVSGNDSSGVDASMALERFLETLEPDLRRYARLRVSGKFATAEEYATALGVTVEVIRNYDRRLRRRRPKWNS